jgi:hypothetical protein
LLKFLADLIAKKWDDAYKLCQFILIYEPQNPHALEYLPLLKEKVEKKDGDEEDESSDDEDTDDDDNDQDDDDSEEETDDDSDDDSDEESEDDDDDDVEIPKTPKILSKKTNL